MTAAIATVSAVVAPNLWVEWFTSLARTADLDATGRAAVAVPLVLRVPLAAALIAWGARTDRRWTVPVGATMAMPVLWPSAFATLVAVVPLIHVTAVDRVTAMRRTPLGATTRHAARSGAACGLLRPVGAGPTTRHLVCTIV